MNVLRAVLLAVLLAVAAATIAACGSDDEGGGSAETTETTQPDTTAPEENEPATVRVLQPVPYGENSFFYPSYVGDELGYFDEEKIKVEIQTASRDLPIPAFVANGDTDVGAAGSDEILTGAAQGGNYKVIYDYYTRAGDTISVPADSDVTDLKQLEGKTLGLASQDDRVFAQTALEVAGADPGKVSFATVGGPGPTVVSRLKSGKVAGYASGISEAAIVEAQLPLKTVLPEGIIGRPSASFMVQPEMIEEQPDVLERFLRAWAKATYAGIAKPEILAQMAKGRIESEFENPRVGEEIIETSVEGQTPVDGAPFGQIREDAWSEAQTQLRDAGILQKEVDLNTLFEPQFIAAANNFDKAQVDQDMENWAEENPASG